MMKKKISALVLAVMAIASVSAFAASTPSTVQTPPANGYYCQGPQTCYGPNGAAGQQGYGCGGYYNGQNQAKN